MSDGKYLGNYCLVDLEAPLIFFLGTSGLHCIVNCVTSELPASGMATTFLEVGGMDRRAPVLGVRTYQLIILYYKALNGRNVIAYRGSMERVGSPVTLKCFNM